MSSNPQANPLSHPYRDLAITVALTAAISTAATMAVQWLASRSKRNKEEESTNQMMMPGYMPQMPGYGFPSPFMQQPPMMLPPGGTLAYFPAAPQAQGPQLPSALAGPTAQRSTRRRAANDTPPEWFAAFAKKQDARFRKLEADLNDDEDEDEDEVG